MKNVFRTLGIDILSILAMPFLALQIIFGSIFSVLMGILQGFSILIWLCGACGILTTVAMFFETLHEGFWAALGSAVATGLGMLFVIGVGSLVMSLGLCVFSWITSFFKAMHEGTGRIVRFFFDTSTEMYEEKMIQKNMAIKILAFPYHLLYITGNIFAFLFSKALMIVSVIGGVAAFGYTEYYLFAVNPVTDFKNESVVSSIFLIILLIGIGVAAAIFCWLLGAAFLDFGNELAYTFMKTAGIDLSEVEEAGEYFDVSASSTRLQQPILGYQNALAEFNLLRERLKPIIDLGKERDFLFEVNKLNETIKNMEDSLLKLKKHYTKQKMLVFQKYLDDFNKTCKNINEALPDIEKKMQNPCYCTKYFDKCDSMESITKRYKQLCKELHPDAGGDEGLFIIMKEEYNSLLGKMAS